ncbi:hypothetical protein ElyMa_003717100 [Elysia marginata]|uniref:Uncharacterized protein n=1 Tax=Elysia marginata TaxID=1093978 RepID=A0AAV4F4A5_9GAST|nr:hypothetical protein ElyMa_003717100 [Elysia marginata]
MLVYVQCVVSLLPHMPAAVRSLLQDTSPGIEMEVYSRYNAADQITKQAISNDLSSLKLKTSNAKSNSGAQHSYVSLSSLPESSTSLVSIAQTLITHKRSAAAAETLGSEVTEEGSSLGDFEFSPLVNTAESTLVAVGASRASWTLLTGWSSAVTAGCERRSVVLLVVLEASRWTR